MNWKYAESMTEPLDVDTTSSKKFVYIRKDISKIQKEDIETGETVTIYQYYERKMTHEDWEAYRNYKEIEELLNANLVTEQILTDMDLRLIEIESKVGVVNANK